MIEDIYSTVFIASKEYMDVKCADFLCDDKDVIENIWNIQYLVIPIDVLTNRELKLNQ